MYDNLRDVEFRLKGTLVEFQGVLRYVLNCEPTDNGYKIKLTKVGWVNLRDKRLVIAGIKTGYMNISGSLVYLSRKPRRAYRQGLRNDNTTCTGELSFQQVFEQIKYGEAYGKPLRRGYKILNSDYAVIEGKLYYRKRLVGIYYEGQPCLDNEMFFLSESLQEIGNV